MSLDTAIAWFRQREADLMRSTVTVHRLTDPTFTPGTGFTETSTVIYTGPALVRSGQLQGQGDVQAGQQEVNVRPARIKLPADTAAQRDDVVTVDASPDARMVGRKYRITQVAVDDWQISGVVLAEEVVT